MWSRALLLALVAAVVLAGPITFLDGVLEVDPKYIAASPLLQSGLNSSEIIPYGTEEFRWLVEQVEVGAFDINVERVLQQYEMTSILGTYANYLLTHSPLLDYVDDLAAYTNEAMSMYYSSLMYQILQLRRSSCTTVAVTMILKNTSAIRDINAADPCGYVMYLSPPPNMPTYIAWNQYNSNYAEVAPYTQAMYTYFQRLTNMMRDYFQQQGWPQNQIYLSGNYIKENYYLSMSVSLFPRQCPLSDNGAYNTVRVCQ